MHTTSPMRYFRSRSYSCNAFSFLTVYLAFRRKPKGVKCFVNELNELYQLSNGSVCVFEADCTANCAAYNYSF